MTEKLYTIKEAAKAMNMSEGWWRKQIGDNQLTYIRIGGKILIPESTITKLLTNGLHKAK